MMYGKVWEFHPAMILKKYKHCPHCGEKLVKEKYDDGQCGKDEWIKALDICDEYYVGEYAQTVFQEFYGHGLYIKDWRTKKVMKFDDYFKAPYVDINASDRELLVGLVERKYGFKLTADFYE